MKRELFDAYDTKNGKVNGENMDVYMAYRSMFDAYLATCKNAYKPSGVEDNLRHCIRLCQSLSWELQGMVRLMHNMHVIDKSKEKEEINRILKSFNSLTMCRAHMKEGEIVSYMCQE